MCQCAQEGKKGGRDSRKQIAFLAKMVKEGLSEELRYGL